jgi:hypothetical protein
VQSGDDPEAARRGHLISGALQACGNQPLCNPIVMNDISGALQTCGNQPLCNQIVINDEGRAVHGAVIIFVPSIDPLSVKFCMRVGLTLALTCVSAASY